jgi:acyl-CoA thioesterase
LTPQCHGERAVAQHASITFLRPARVGEGLRAEAMERVRHGRSGIYDVRVSRDDGGVVAEFRGHARSSGERFFPTEH